MPNPHSHPNRFLAPPQHFFKGQFVHLSLILLLLFLSLFFADWQVLASRTLWGLNAQTWFVLALVEAPLHTLYVWFAWRMEMVYGKVSPLFGGKGFKVYKAVFMVLLVARLILILLLGLADYGSLPMHWTLMWILAPLVVLPAAYTMFSVVRYFGFDRAVGGDHFFATYREGMVVQGIFQYVPNSMYTFALAAFFAIAIWCQSGSALIAAAFHYLTVWVHYFCTEKPDMKVLYS